MLAGALLGAGEPGARQARVEDLPLGLPADVSAAGTLLYAEDRRELTEDLLKLTRSDDAPLRARAALAVGRVGLPVGGTRLLELIRDPDPSVRALSAFGIGLLELDLEPATVAATRRRLSEQLVPLLHDAQPLVAAQAIRALGRIADGAAIGPIQALLERPADYPVSVVVAAIQAWWRLPGASPGPLVGHLESSDAEVRRAAVTSLGRLGDPDAMPPLVPMLEDPDAAIRAEALRGLRTAPEAVAQRHLGRLLRDDQWRVVCGALSWTISRWQEDGEIDQALLSAVLRASGNNNRHVQRLAFEALAQVADGLSVPEDRLVQALHSGDPATRLAALDAIVGAGGDLLEDVFDDLLEVYQIDRPPADPGVGPIPTVLDQSSLEAAAVARALGSGKDDDDGTWLRILADHGSLAARAAALRSLAEVDSAAAVGRATSWLADGPAVLTAVAAEVVGRLKATGSLPPRREAESWPDLLWRAQRGLGETASAEPRLVVLNTLLSIDREMMRLRVSALTPDPDRVVRLWALRNLTPEPGPRLEAIVGEALGPVATGRSPADYREIAAEIIAIQRRPPRLRMTTPRGDFEVQLQPSWAPLTVRAMLAWVAAGDLDNIVFHRVVPDFVVQAGDPSAVGYGSAAGSLRNEETPIPYRAATVGIALAGRDTGGSQFFIVHSRQPHLTGIYPAFGTVTEGRGVVDRIQPGDRLGLEIVSR